MSSSQQPKPDIAIHGQPCDLHYALWSRWHRDCPLRYSLTVDTKMARGVVAVGVHSLRRWAFHPVKLYNAKGASA